MTAHQHPNGWTCNECEDREERLAKATATLKAITDLLDGPGGGDKPITCKEVSAVINTLVAYIHAHH